MGLTENNHNTVLSNLRAGGDVGTSLSSAFSSSFCGGVDWVGGILCFHFRRMLDLDWKSTHKKGGEGGSGKKRGINY